MALIRKGTAVFVILAGFGLTALAGNSPEPVDGPPAPVPALKAVPTINLVGPVARPRMAPELALQQYLQGAEFQLSWLHSYTDTTTIDADLPATSQHGRYRLRRMFAAPRTLAFTALEFVGDNFVKGNVITRLLQSEVDHVQKGDGYAMAITAENYKFGYKGTDQIDGHMVYVYQLKPRQKRVGLFKGKVYLDVYSGNIRRAEGQMVKSPSLFVKKVQFTQDYAQVGEFNLVSRIHSVAETRIVGKAVVDIVHDYAEASGPVPTTGKVETVSTDVTAGPY